MSQRVPFTKMVLFSDGAPTQYKNKCVFSDLSHAFMDFGVDAERHFFGTCHGKGPCGPEFVTLKKAVNDRVKTWRVDLVSASDFYTFCAENFTRSEGEHCHYKRSFFGVPKADIM